MAKDVSIEISTIMSPLDGDAISDAISGADAEIAKIIGIASMGGWVTNPQTERMQRSTKRYLRSSTGGYRRIHFARAQDKALVDPDVPLDLFRYLRQRDPQYAQKGEIGSHTIVDIVDNGLVEAGISTPYNSNHTHQFDVVHCVEPIKRRASEPRWVFALGQLSTETSPKSVTQLDSIDYIVNCDMATNFPTIYKMQQGGNEKPALEGLVPLASTYIQDTEMLDFIVKYLSDHILDPTADFTANGLDISHES